MRYKRSELENLRSGSGELWLAGKEAHSSVPRAKPKERKNSDLVKWNRLSPKNSWVSRKKRGLVILPQINHER